MSEVQTCPIWGTPAQLLASCYGDLKLRSWRTDGEYRITGMASSAVARKTPDEKARLTTWIVDQHRAGEVTPLVNDEVLDRITSSRPLRLSTRKERFFLLALSRGFQPGSHFQISGQVNERQLQDSGAISAWTECRTDPERNAFLIFLKEDGLINFGGSDAITLSGKGFERMESLESRGAPTTQAFVAMWFDPSMDEAYKSGVAPAIEDTGYQPLRVDQKEHSNKIDDEIIAEIRRSRFVIADFTCDLAAYHDRTVAVSRGGVYYEAGFAQGLGIPVIWTCRANCIDYVHFDTRQYNHIVWETPVELREKLNNRIRAVIV